MYTIRDIRKFDVHACYAIAKSLWDRDTAHGIYEELMDSFDFPSTWPPIYIVAEHSGEVVGFTGFRRCLFMKGAWEVCWTNVRQDHHRKGLGRLFSEARVQRAKDMGGKYFICSAQDPAFAIACGNKVIDQVGDTYILAKEI